MWAWLRGLDPLWLVGGGSLLLGLVAIAGWWGMESIFRREYTAPPDEGSLPARYASGEFPVVAYRTLAQDWRDQLEEPPVSMMPRDMPQARVGRHRWAWVGQHTQRLSLNEIREELNRGQDPRDYSRSNRGVSGHAARGPEQEAGSHERQRRQDARRPEPYGKEGGAYPQEAAPVSVASAPEPGWHKGCSWCWRTIWH